MTDGRGGPRRRAAGRIRRRTRSTSCCPSRQWYSRAWVWAGERVQVARGQVLVEETHLLGVGQWPDAPLERGVPHRPVDEVDAPPAALHCPLAPGIVRQREDQERALQVRQVAVERRLGQAVELPGASAAATRARSPARRGCRAAAPAASGCRCRTPGECLCRPRARPRRRGACAATATAAIRGLPRGRTPPPANGVRSSGNPPVTMKTPCGGAPVS